MTLYYERDDLTVLSGAVDPEGDPLTVTEVNGDPTLVGVAFGLSIGGLVTVSSDGTVVFDDTGFTPPGAGESLADSVIATVSDGSSAVPVAVDIQIHGA